MIYTWKITEPLVIRVKELLENNSKREVARRVGVSFYTVWCISMGKYDNNEPLHGKIMEGRCPITGFKLDNKLSMGKNH
jgi:hypothetical protein